MQNKGTILLALNWQDRKTPVREILLHPVVNYHRKIEGQPMKKPFHLMTRDEQTAERIAQNRAIAEKLAQAKTQTPPARSGGAGVRMTPDERAHLGGVIRKVQK